MLNIYQPLTLNTKFEEAKYQILSIILFQYSKAEGEKITQHTLFTSL